jgi:hypothetical protein
MYRGLLSRFLLCLFFRIDQTENQKFKVDVEQRPDEVRSPKSRDIRTTCITLRMNYKIINAPMFSIPLPTDYNAGVRADSN